MSETAAPATGKVRRELERAVIRFAGDSGDGMQLTGEQFTTESAWAGNDLATLPNFPAEIRAPAGTLAGVSAFQLNFAAEPIFTPGDDLDVLVAMNPAALRMNLDDLRPGRAHQRADGSWPRVPPRRSDHQPRSYRAGRASRGRFLVLGCGRRRHRERTMSLRPVPCARQLCAKLRQSRRPRRSAPLPT